jgi:mersacidin/lichenicidin family type 2 lantibiotic
MNQEMIVRAWEDPIYRASLAPQIIASLPANPAGASMNELDGAEMRDVLGANHSPWMFKSLVCTFSVNTILAHSPCNCKCK